MSEPEGKSVPDDGEREQREPSANGPAADAAAAPQPSASVTSIVPYRTAASAGRSKWASRRVARLVAVTAIAAAVGAVSGALATIGVSEVLQRHVFKAQPQQTLAEASQIDALKQTIWQLNSALSAAKIEADRAARASANQLARLGERLDKLAKAQDDTTLKITRLADAQDKTRLAAASATPTPAHAAPAIAAPETTSSIAPRGDIKASAPSAKPPIVDGWVLTSVGRGGAIVAGRSGFYEVYPGDPLPGLGRVAAVRYQEGRWVVVTPKGLIIRR
jgi:hypothetical protein